MSTEHFGKYLLIEKIGIGGMAEVHLAKQKGIKGFEKVLAIKRILPHLTEDPEFVSMFINEAKLAALLSHQNVVQIFELGHFENSYYIAMEYVMGKDLRTVLRNTNSLDQPLTIGQSLLMMTKILSGLDYAHRKKDLAGEDLNIVHRDISPQNVLVSYEGEIKLVDFGIAKAASLSSETHAGFIKGKLSYMAPEQAWGKPVDRRTDIFAAGIMLYEMITHNRLYKGENEISVLEKVREARILPLPRHINDEVSPELESIMLKALAKDPSDRFQTASEFQMILEDLISQKGYDFSDARLSHFLQALFAEDLRRDSDRFRAAELAAGSTPTPDTKTQVRPKKHQRVQPLAPSSTKTVAVPKSSSGWRVWTSLRRASLAVILFFLLAVWSAHNDLDFLYSIKIRIPESEQVLDRLAILPNQVFDLFFSKPHPEYSHAAIALQRKDTPHPVEPEDFISDEEPSEIPTASVSAPANPDLPAISAEKRQEIRRLFRQAERDYHQKKLNRVEESLRRIIELDPQSPRAYHLLGTVKAKQKKPLQAIQILENASRKFPDHAAVHYDLGFLYMDRGVVSLAQRALGRGVELNPVGGKAEKAKRALAELAKVPLEDRILIQPKAEPPSTAESTADSLNLNKEVTPQ